MRCPKCDGEDIQVLSAGEIVCNNPGCMNISINDPGASTPIGRLNLDGQDVPTNQGSLTTGHPDSKSPEETCQATQ